MASPLEQFTIKPIIPEIGFTNASAFMLLTTGIVFCGFMYASRKRALVPGRAQSVVEMFYGFIFRLLKDVAGEDAVVFFPLIFSLFMYILTANYLGMLPGAFTITSHAIVTFTLACFIIGTVIIYGLWKHGAQFLNLFVPSGLPKILVPFMALIELVSFLSRPVSLCIRLFANMVAGHVALKIFAGFILSLWAAGGVATVLAPFPILLIIAVTALELLVCGLQAFVFTVLSCIYLKDALHPSH